MTVIDPRAMAQNGNGDAAARPSDAYGFREFGVSGLKHSAGNLLEEWLPQLQYERAAKIYREMRDNDPIVWAFLLAIEMLLRGVPWDVEPAEETRLSDGQSSDEKVDFLKSCIMDMSHTWEDFIAEVVSMLQYGWAYFACVYKRRAGDNPKDPTRHSRYTDGKWGWRKFAIRSQDTLSRWEFDDTGGIQGMHQRDPQTYQEHFIPIEAALLFRTSIHKNTPEGRSILRGAYMPWWYKKRLQEIEAIGVERDLAGLPVIGVPPELMSANATSDQAAAYAEWKAIGQRIRLDDQACIVKPNAYDMNGNPLFTVELLGSPGSKQMPTDTIINRYRQDIAMAALADVILLGHEKVGTQALSITKEDLFIRSLEAYLDSVAAVLNDIAVPRLWRLNGWPTTDMPKFTHGELKGVNLKDFSEVVRNLSQAGMPLFPEEETERHIRSLMELPEPKNEMFFQREEEVKEAVTEQTIAPPEPNPSGQFDGGQVGNNR